MIALVAPVERDDVLRQTFDKTGMAQHYVAPEHGPLAAATRRVAHFQQEFKILARIGYLERFVAANIHKRRSEVRQKLVEERLDKRDGTGVCRIERRRKLLDRSPWRHGAAFGKLCEMVVLGMRQPAFHVTEGVLVGDKLDSLHLAIRVKLANLGGSHRIGLLPNLRVRRIGESMLGIQLKLIVAAPREDINDFAERSQRGDAVAAHVQHVATHIKHTKRASASPL